MESVVFSFKEARVYYSLTKPGIIMGNAITAAAGFILASSKQFDIKLCIMMLIGVCFMMASACVCNNCIDRKADAKMKRTKKRALAEGSMAPSRALFFAALLGLSGAFILAAYVSLLSLSFTLLGFFVYVVLYSFCKYRSMYATWIGSIAGAVPPVVGYCAASGSFDSTALLLFFMVAIWQMPHFFAIAIYRIDDYNAASIPVLPRIKGILAAKVHMLIYIIAFMVTASLLPLSHRVSYRYLFASIPLSMLWAGLCIRGFTTANHAMWAKKMFLFSLVVIIGVCIAIPLTVFKFSTGQT